MTIIFPVLLLLIFVGCVAFLYGEGMWANAVRLINVVTAALLATNFWEPLAKFLENNISDSFTYLWDFIALWALFAVLLVIFRLLTAFASKVKVRFLGIADRIGSIFFAVCVGWALVCFATMTLHTAPLARDFLFGGFQPEKSRMFFGMAGPDRMWLGFVQRLSRGAYSRTTSEDERDLYGSGGEGREAKLAVFDRQRHFIPKYASRREAVEANVESGGGNPKALLTRGGPGR